MPLIQINTKGYTAAAKRMVAEVAEMDIIPPANGKVYTRTKHIYVTGEKRSVALDEKRANLVKLLAEDPELPYWKAFIRAGYAYGAYFNEAGNVKRITAHLTGMCKTRLNQDAITLLNYLKHGAAEELFIDAQWVLAESVNLYEECRREGKFTQAARLLESISTHVDVDAKVSNKLVVETAIDYAAILNEANDRVVDTEYEVLSPVESKSLELHQDTSGDAI